ncbi:alanine racemase [Bosea sp. (in: a-proteobacteria)]|uniref:alanine racemase n=1 Tax=Bosea sp. (in: a-proteobacteria) TaxID=1871050 RepID=UPI001AD53C8E|nr:alanine racemase [Bosea sp. (in: a-proteobacteria)]MBN9443170.1 alanine racemase [Bosea sp. (in: a-proteobacteria)]
MEQSAPLPVETPILAGNRLTIDLAALARNWQALAAIAAGAETAAAVKGNGYGIGLEPAVRALAAAGCRTFFVALPDEGVRTRTTAPDATIYVLNGLARDLATVHARHNLRPVIGSPGELADWAAYRAQGGRGQAALHVDTGMNRLGLTFDEARALAADPRVVERLGLSLVMSHLACADTPGHPLSARQLATMRDVKALFPGLAVSLANTAGIALDPAYHFDLVRPGIGLYGGPFIAGRPPLETVVTAEARIIQIRDVPAGETVGYGATATTGRPSRIAILSTGYADGYLRAGGSTDQRRGADVVLHGRRAPLFGRISMDMMAIDVTDVPGAERGDWVELFGPAMPVAEVAEAAGTISYEFLTSLGSRYDRRYV